MIPQAFVLEWAHVAPWQQFSQVEHDLVLSRALVDVFSDEYLSRILALRGGTALHKLFLAPQRRFSEDIDLVQVEVIPEAGEMFDRLRARLRPWLGEAAWKQAGNMATLYFRFETETEPRERRKLKVEVQCREHGSVYPLERRRFRVESPWFEGQAEIPVYVLDELLGTKLRALYQRPKGRDLFDLWLGLTELGGDPGRILECFHTYLGKANPPMRIGRQDLEENLEQKMRNRRFLEDLGPLLPPDVVYDVGEAKAQVVAELVARL